MTYIKPSVAPAAKGKQELIPVHCCECGEFVKNVRGRKGLAIKVWCATCWAKKRKLTSGWKRGEA
jgi:hypothetical protein